VFSEVHLLIRELKGRHQPVVFPSLLVSHQSWLVVRGRLSITVGWGLEDVGAGQGLVAVSFPVEALSPLLVGIIFLLALGVVVHAEAVLAEIVDVVVLVQEGQADLADRQIAGEAQVVVLLAGGWQPIPEEEVL
jgi:hypothetical protein